jgi:hypothetical protein
LAGYAVSSGQDSECVSGTGDQEGDGPVFGSFEDVGEFGKPFVVVNGCALARVKAMGSEAEDGVGQVVESVVYLLSDHAAEDGHAQGAEDAQQGPEDAAHAGLP